MSRKKSASKRRQDQHEADDRSRNSEHSIEERPVRRVGRGIPLFQNEAEDDFDSSDSEDGENDSDSDSDEGEGGADAYQHMIVDDTNLSFEERWAAKLRRTQELIDRGGTAGNNRSY